MRSRDIPIDDIVTMLTDRFDDLVHELYPGCLIAGGVAYPSPKSKWDVGSFHVFLADNGKKQRGHWKRYSQRIGGGPLNLITYWLSSETRHTGDYGEAVRWAKRWLGIDGPMSAAERQAFDEQRRRDRIRAERANREAEIRAAGLQARAEAHAREMFAATVGVTEGDPVWTYLTKARRLPLERVPLSLRLHPGMKHFGSARDWFGPAMIASLTNGKHKMPGVHCTFLKPDGKGKAPIGASAKLMRGSIQGGIVPIGLGSAPVHELAAAGKAEPVILAEGIETALGLACAIPEARIWACLSLGNIAHAPVDHPAISTIVVAAENDVKPQAVEMLEDTLERLSRFGKPVTTLRSPIGSDFADCY